MLISLCFTKSPFVLCIYASLAPFVLWLHPNVSPPQRSWDRLSPRAPLIVIIPLWFVLVAADAIITLCCPLPSVVHPSRCLLESRWSGRRQGNSWLLSITMSSCPLEFYWFGKSGRPADIFKSSSVEDWLCFWCFLSWVILILGFCAAGEELSLLLTPICCYLLCCWGHVAGVVSCVTWILSFYLLSGWSWHCSSVEVLCARSCMTLWSWASCSWRFACAILVSVRTCELPTRWWIPNVECYLRLWVQFGC